jgi:hypothetical protein
MTEVPKVVYYRLQNPANGIGHPEAEQLAAFAEQALTQGEREVVLGHLALCGECREVIALALPPLEEASLPKERQTAVVAAPVSTESGRWRLFAWPSLRWAALAAGVAVAASVLIWSPGRRNQPGTDQARVTHVVPDQSHAPVGSPSPAAKAEEPASVPAIVAGLNSSPVLAKKQRFASPSDKSSNPFESGGASGAALALRAADGPAAFAAANESEIDTRAKASTVDQVRGSGHESDPASGGVTLMARNESPAIEKAKPVPPALDAGEQEKSSPWAAGSLVVNGRNTSPALKQAVTSDVSVAWQIEKGVLQGSKDGGQSWQTVLQTEHELLCYTSYGDLIWAGGRAGILYRSVDNGVTWTRVRPAIQDQPLTSDVTHITLRSPALRSSPPSGLETVLSAGAADAKEVWSSADGGRTWSKK